MIEINNLEKRYSKDFSINIKKLSLPNKGCVFLSGDSGSGKSSLINLLCGVDRDYSGEIIINGVDLSSLSDDEFANYRNSVVGYIHQTPLLFDDLNVYENLIFGVDLTSSNKENLNQIIDILGINKLINSKCKDLSGGEKQKVAIARIFLKDYPIVCADEPTGSLDSRSALEINDFLKEYSKNHLVLIVSHNNFLINKYADYIIKIKNGCINENIVSIDDALQKNNVKKSKISLKQIKFLLKNIFHNNKFKNLTCSFMMMFSFISLGCVSIIKDDVCSSLNSVFSHYFSKNEIIAKQKGLQDNQYYRKDSIEESYLSQLINKYDDKIDNYYYYYDNNFNLFFPDTNELCISNVTSAFQIDNYSIDSFNNFLPIEYINNDEFIIKKDLELDEIILSFSDKQIDNICFNLHLLRTAESLYEYVKSGSLFVSLNLQNIAWDYDDEEIFKVVGFVNDSNSNVYHSDQFFNLNLFENQLKLIPTLYEDSEIFPWTVKKIATLHFTNDESLNYFLLNSYFDNFLNKFYFEKKKIGKYSQISMNRRDFNNLCLFCFVKDNSGFDCSLAESLNENDFQNVSFSSFGGYVSLGNNLISGFANQTFLSNNQEELLDVIDLYESSYSNNRNFQIKTKDSIIQGGIKSKEDNALKIFNIDGNSLKYGRTAENFTEIVVSSNIMKRLKISEKDLFSNVYIGSINGFSFSSLGNETIDFGLYAFRVVGVIESSENVIYQKPFFKTLLFQNYLNCSFNFLNTKSVTFEIRENDRISDVLLVLKNSFEKYTFSSPYYELNTSMNETLVVVQNIFIFFAIFSSIITFVLIFQVMQSIVISSERELTTLIIYGYSLDESSKFFKVYASLITILSFLGSSLSCFAISILINKIIGDKFNSPIAYSMNLTWIITNFLLTLLIYFFSIFSIKRRVKSVSLSYVLKK